MNQVPGDASQLNKNDRLSVGSDKQNEWIWEQTLSMIMHGTIIILQLWRVTRRRNEVESCMPAGKISGTVRSYSSSLPVMIPPK